VTAWAATVLAETPQAAALQRLLAAVRQRLLAAVRQASARELSKVPSGVASQRPEDSMTGVTSPQLLAD
tara:strand:+ start:281 stop:487 length:207 start_codon:yes stop_codon:yes gene_type:complete